MNNFDLEEFEKRFIPNSDKLPPAAKNFSTDTGTVDERIDKDMNYSHFYAENPYYLRVKKIGYHEYETKDFCQYGEH